MIKYLKNFLSGFYDTLWKDYIFWLILFSFVAVINYVAIFYITKGEFFYEDTDCYMRAIRIEDWWQNFQWAETVFPFSNPPHGFVLHFTRINDVIWSLFSLPLALFMPAKDAIFYGGFAFSPLFMTLSILSIFWGVRPYIPQFKQRNLLFLFTIIISLILLHKLTNRFDFSSPDHHSLMAFVYSFNLAVLMRSFIKTNSWQMFFAGIIAAMGIWASSAIEGFSVVFPFLLLISLDWIFSPSHRHAPLFYTLGLFLGTLAAWLINPPYGGYAVMDISRLSVIHVALTALIFMSYLVLTSLNLIKYRNKIFALIAAAFASALIMLCTFGTSTLVSPVYNPDVYAHFIPRIAEMKHSEGYSLIIIFASLCICTYFLWHSKCRQLYIINLSIITLLTSIIAFLIARYFIYQISLFAMLNILFIITCTYVSEKKRLYKYITITYTLGLIFYLYSFNYIPSLRTIPQLPGKIVLCNLFNAPMITYYQNLDTVGSPYHSNIEGVVDNHTMWYTTDEAELKRLLQKHQVTTIYLSPSSCSDNYYIKPKENTDKLYGKIISGKNVYPWLEKIAENLYTINYDKF